MNTSASLFQAEHVLRKMHDSTFRPKYLLRDCFDPNFLLSPSFLNVQHSNPLISTGSTSALYSMGLVLSYMFVSCPLHFIEFPEGCTCQPNSSSYIFCASSIFRY